MIAPFASGQGNTTTKQSVIEVKKILNTLAYCFELDGIIPELRIAKQLKQPAMYTNYQRPVITLDQKMFDISRSFGKDAKTVIAFVLGHEMAHHYLKHSPGDVSDLKTHEKDADRWGCFYSHVAGYKITPTLYSQVIDKIYEVYQLNDHIPHYPEKAARKKLGLQKIQEIQEFNLAEVFNTAKFLFAIGKTDQSIACLEFIFNKHFKSAEICNNLAAAYLKKITQAKPLYQRIFMLPFEFDSNTSLRSDNPSKLNLPVLYEKSEILLRKAISIKKNYAAASLNLASLQILKKKYGSAIENLLELKNQQSKLSSQACNLLALAFALKNEPTKAEKWFKAAMSDPGNHIAKCNYQIYTNLAKSNPEQSFSNTIASLKTYEVADIIEQVQKKCACGNQELAATNSKGVAFPAKPATRLSKTVINMQPYFEIRPATQALPSGYRFVKIKLEEDLEDADENAGKSLIKYEVCFSSENKQTLKGLNIKVGTPIKTLLSKNTQPNRLLGNFYIYENQNLVVEIWQNNVIGWMIYRKIE